MSRFPDRKQYRAIMRRRSDEIGELLHSMKMRDEAENNPLIDIYECEETIVIEFDLPGFNPEEIQLRINGVTLILEAEKPKLQTEGRYICMERSYGRFYHAVQLSGCIDPCSISAEYRLGVLRVVCPKNGKDLLVPIKEIRP